MKKLCVFLPEPLKVYYKKGEIKERYYNPLNFFDEVHFISFCKKDIDEKLVQRIVGSSLLKIHTVGKMSLFNLLLLTKRLIKLIKEIKPDAIRGYDPSIRGALSIYIGKKLNLPTIISVHNHMDEQRKFDRRPILKLRRLLERYSLKNADKVICVTEYVKSYVKKYRIKDTSVIYNRVYPEQFCARENKKHTPKKQKVLLSIGRLDIQKYQECLIRAIKDLDVKLILVGSGRLCRYLRKLAERLNIKQKVDFVWSVPHNQIQNYYLLADIFTVATHYEGFCIPVLEAMAASLPIVASDIEPISELVGDSAILIKNNFRDFRAAFIKLLKKPQLFFELGRKAYERMQFFNGNIMEEKEEQLYKQILKPSINAQMVA